MGAIFAFEFDFEFVFEFVFAGDAAERLAP
jgi:hypothetical protein